MNFDTKIVRFSITDPNVKFENAKKSFDEIDGYKDYIKGYIFKDIMTDFELNDPKFFQSRIQVFLSSILLRSLLLKESAVLELNNKNLVGVYSILKSFLEIPAVLGYILHLLNTITENEKLLEKFVDLSLGNRGNGTLRVGTRDIPNILRMFNHMETELKKVMSPHQTSTLQQTEKIMYDFYELVCNYSHPNYDAHSLIGELEEPGIWKVFDFEKLRETEFNGYKPPFVTAIGFTRLLCDAIVKHPKANNFNLLKNNPYFN